VLSSHEKVYKYYLNNQTLNKIKRLNIGDGLDLD